MSDRAAEEREQRRRLRHLEAEHLEVLQAALSVPGGGGFSERLHELEHEADLIRLRLGIPPRNPASRGGAVPAGSSARLFRDVGAFHPPDDSAWVWGGFALGSMFALIGLVMGLTAGWQATAIGLLVGGICMIGIQWIWSWRRRGRRRGPE